MTAYESIAIESPARTDHELVRLAQNGSLRHFDTLVSRHRDRLHEKLTKLIGSSAVADDIVQDALIRAYVHLSKFRFKSAFYTWLFRIAMNCRRRYVTQRIQMAVDFEPHEQKSGPGKQNAPSERLEREEMVTRVRSAIASLPESHRRIIVLRDLEGRDYKTISTILDIELGTVRSRLFRARQRLKQDLMRDDLN